MERKVFKIENGGKRGFINEFFLEKEKLEKIGTPSVGPLGEFKGRGKVFEMETMCEKGKGGKPLGWNPLKMKMRNFENGEIGGKGN